MGMTASDVQVGVVNSFEGSKINAKIQNGDIVELPRDAPSSTLPNVSRPFVCVGVQNERSQWAEITTEAGNSQLRLEIDDAYRSWQDGDRCHSQNIDWKAVRQYINSAVFEGPNAIWASLATDHNSAGNFKIVTPAGIQKIRDHLNNNVLEAPLF